MKNKLFALAVSVALVGSVAAFADFNGADDGSHAFQANDNTLNSASNNNSSSNQNNSNQGNKTNVGNDTTNTTSSVAVSDLLNDKSSNQNNSNQGNKTNVGNDTTNTTLGFNLSADKTNTVSGLGAANNGGQSDVSNSGNALSFNLAHTETETKTSTVSGYGNANNGGQSDVDGSFNSKTITKTETETKTNTLSGVGNSNNGGESHVIGANGNTGGYNDIDGSVFGNSAPVVEKGGQYNTGNIAEDGGFVQNGSLAAGAQVAKGDITTYSNCVSDNGTLNQLIGTGVNGNMTNSIFFDSASLGLLPDAASINVSTQSLSNVGNYFAGTPESSDAAGINANSSLTQVQTGSNYNLNGGTFNASTNVAAH